MADENGTNAPRRSFNEQLTYLRGLHTAAQRELEAVDAWTDIDEIARRQSRFNALDYLLDGGGQADRALKRVEALKLNRGYEARQVEEVATTQAYHLRKELEVKRARIAEIDVLLAQDTPLLPAELKARAVAQGGANPFSMTQAYEQYKQSLRRERAQLEREIAGLEQQLAKLNQASTK